MTTQKTDLGAAYVDEIDWQEVLDKIDSYVHHWRGKVEDHEANCEQWQDCLAANKEKLSLAEKVLSGPTQFGISSRARVDRAEALAMIERCKEEIAAYRGPIERAQGAVAEYEAKRKAFPREKLRAQRALEVLRQRCGRRRESL